MNHSLETAERHAFRAFWNDGLLDVMLGLVVLLTGISWWRDVAVLGAISPVIFVSLWTPLRRKLVEPRMGFVEFSGSREVMARSFRYALTAFFAGTMLLGLVIYSLWNQDILPHPRQWIAGFPLILIGIPCIFFALFTQCRRFTVYGLVMCVMAIETVIQGWRPHVGLIGSGLVVSAAGAFILWRFIARHPLNRGEE